MIKVRALRKNDEAEWRRLWDTYNAFYEAEIPDTVTRQTWLRLRDRRAHMIGRLAEDDGTIVGFANAVLHAGTWASAPLCYLEDLYVDPAARGRGVGKSLIDDLIQLGRAKGWDSLYWHTREN